MNHVFGSANGGNEEHWLSVSDLMAGLMMVFLFIAISFMNHAIDQRDAIQDIAKSHAAARMAIYSDLFAEFKKDLDRWDAVIDDEKLTFSFESPKVLFDSGKATLKPGFMDILDDFSSRYFGVLSKHQNVISEIRIEGHTSPEYEGNNGIDEFYLNSHLSNKRAWEVFKYIYNLTSVKAYKHLINECLVLVATSSTDLVMITESDVDETRSRRVVFRVITDDTEQLKNIATQ